MVSFARFCLGLLAAGIADGLRGALEEVYLHAYDCTGIATKSTHHWEHCRSWKEGDKEETGWKSMRFSFDEWDGENLINTFTVKTYTDKGCDEDKREDLIKKNTYDWCKPDGNSGRHQFKYIPFVGQYFKYNVYVDDKCEELSQEGWVMPTGADLCQAMGDYYENVVCNSEEECTVKRFSDKDCKNSHDVRLDLTFKADGRCAEIADYPAAEFAAHPNPRREAAGFAKTYMKFTLHGTDSVDGSLGIRMSQVVLLIIFAVACTGW